jgi:hypothetical protein
VEIIPCLVAPNWSPTSAWLKFLIDGINYVDFRNTDDIQMGHAITQLAQRIVDTLSVSKSTKQSKSTNFIISSISQGIFC